MCLDCQVTAIDVLTEIMHDYLIKFGRVYRRLTDEHDARHDTQEVSLYSLRFFIS